MTTGIPVRIEDSDVQASGVGCQGSILSGVFLGLQVLGPVFFFQSSPRISFSQLTPQSYRWEDLLKHHPPSAGTHDNDNTAGDWPVAEKRVRVHGCSSTPLLIVIVFR